MLKLCEENCIEIADELYEAYGDVCGKAEHLDNKCFKTYVLPCGALLTLEETQQFISKGTTGLSSWMAGEYLAEWALENPSTFQDRCIIELGCGTGLTGLSICSMSSPSQYIFSDCHNEVFKALKCNLELNGFVMSQTDKESLYCDCKRTHEPHTESDMHKQLKELALRSQDNHDYSDHSYTASLHDSKLTTRKEIALQKFDQISHCIECLSDYSENGDIHDLSSCTTDFIARYLRHPSSTIRHLNEDCANHSWDTQVDICKLDWTTLKKSDLRRFSTGIILAADVVYDTELTPALVKALHMLLNTCGDKRGKPVAFIASTIRNPQTYELFLNCLYEHRICYSEVTKPINQVFYYDQSCEIKIIKLEV